MRRVTNPSLSEKEKKKLEKKQAEEAKKTLKKQDKDKKTDTKRGSMRFLRYQEISMIYVKF